MKHSIRHFGSSMKRVFAALLALALLAGCSAMAEGKVTVYMPSPAGLADKLAEGFTAATGIAVDSFQGTTGEILARLEAEEANPIADVVILVSWSDGLSVTAAGAVAMAWRKRRK